MAEFITADRTLSVKTADMSNINKHGVSMKRKMTGIIGGSMFAMASGTLLMFDITGGTLPASATIANTNGHIQMVAKKSPRQVVGYSTPRLAEMKVARNMRSNGLGRTGRTGRG